MSCFYIWNCALHQEGVVSLWLNACLYLFKISGQFVSLYQRTCMTVSAKFIILIRNRNISFQVNEMIVKNIKHKTYFKFECFTWTNCQEPFCCFVNFLDQRTLKLYSRFRGHSEILNRQYIAEPWKMKSTAFCTTTKRHYTYECMEN